MVGVCRVCLEGVVMVPVRGEIGDCGDVCGIIY
jgi:hypothetical protein